MKPDAFANKKGREDDIFAQLYHKFFPYWPLFLLLIVLFVVAGGLYYKWKIPTYEAYAKLLIKDEQKGMIESKMLESLNIFGGSKLVENEIEVLKSNLFMNSVVKNLGLYAPVFEEKKSRVVPAYVSSPIKIRIKNPDLLIPEKKIPFTFKSANSILVIEGKEYKLNEWYNTKWGEIIFLPNEKSLNYPIYENLYFSLVPVNVMGISLLKVLDVSPTNKLSSILQLKITDATPARAVDILNELVSLYLQEETKNKNLLAQNTVALVDDRLRNVEGQLDSAEFAIQRFRTVSGVYDISAQGKQYLESVGQYDRQIEQNKLQIALLGEVEKFILSNNNSSGLVPSGLGLNDPVIEGLLEKLNNSQLEYERLKRTTGENSPILVSVRDQIEKLKPSILQNVRTQRSSLEINRNNLTSASNRYSAMLSSIPGKERQLIEISREQGVKNSIYSFLLQKREEAALSYASSSVNDTRVVDMAYASVFPVSPNIILITLMAMALGLFSGVVLISLREDFGKRLLFRKDVEKIITAPVIGEILYKKLSVFESSGNEVFSENDFKLLRNNLFFQNQFNENKVVFLTSAADSEGKTFISIQLAKSLLTSGKKVALVDLNFSAAKISAEFGLGEKQGISDYLTGEAHADSIFYKTASNLYVIPAGLRVADAGEMLLSDNLKHLILKLKNEFDQIIISGGGVVYEPNIKIIAGLADITVFVIRHRITKQSHLVMQSNNDFFGGLKSPLVVFNGVKPRGFLLRMFGSGFGYGYTTKA